MTDPSNALYENLLDAGCDARTAERYSTIAGRGEWDLLLTELTRERKAILEDLHRAEKQIDCLDFLVYEIRKYHQGGSHRE